MLSLKTHFWKWNQRRSDDPITIHRVLSTFNIKAAQQQHVTCKVCDLRGWEAGGRGGSTVQTQQMWHFLARVCGCNDKTSAVSDTFEQVLIVTTPTWNAFTLLSPSAGDLMGPAGKLKVTMWNIKWKINSCRMGPCRSLDSWFLVFFPFQRRLPHIFSNVCSVCNNWSIIKDNKWRVSL